MQEDRFPLCRAIHESEETAAVFRMYRGAGHTPRPAQEDIIAFHERAWTGEPIADIRADLGGNVPHLHAYIEYAPREPRVGEQVAFDATRSSVADRELLAFVWEFDEETVVTGDLVTHTFEVAGGHNVRLTVTDEADESYTATEQIVVVDPDETTDGAETDAETPTVADIGPTETRTDGEVDPMPGFTGGVTALALGSAAYWYRQRIADTEADR